MCVCVCVAQMENIHFCGFCLLLYTREYPPHILANAQWSCGICGQVIGFFFLAIYSFCISN